MSTKEKILKQAIDHCTTRFINQGKPANQNKMTDPNLKVEEIDENQVDTPEIAAGQSDDETQGDDTPEEVPE